MAAKPSVTAGLKCAPADSKGGSQRPVWWTWIACVPSGRLRSWALMKTPSPVDVALLLTR